LIFYLERPDGDFWVIVLLLQLALINSFSISALVNLDGDQFRLGFIFFFHIIHRFSTVYISFHLIFYLERTDGNFLVLVLLLQLALINSFSISALVNLDGDRFRLGFICFFTYKGHMGNFFCLSRFHLFLSPCIIDSIVSFVLYWLLGSHNPSLQDNLY
jgi:hypothetical protein